MRIEHLAEMAENALISKKFRQVYRKLGSGSPNPASAATTLPKIA